jgi:hypothetical protein
MKFIKNKKALALIITALLTATTFSACQNKTTAKINPDGNADVTDEDTPKTTRPPATVTDRKEFLGEGKEYVAQIGEEFKYKQLLTSNFVKVGYSQPENDGKRYILLEFEITNLTEDEISITTLNPDALALTNDGTVIGKTLNTRTLSVIQEYYANYSYKIEPESTQTVVFCYLAPETPGEFKFFYSPNYSKSTDTIAYTFKAEDVVELTSLK